MLTLTSNGGSIKIGNDVLIANNVVIRAANHNYKDESKKFMSLDT